MYNEFAYFYDELNGAANYKRLHRFIRRTFRRQGLKQGIVADLGCGTGTLSLALAKDGYDVLAADISSDMLEVLSDKLAGCPKLAGRIQLLHQDLLKLDFFGTIQGAVSTFDTLNHIGPAQQLAAAIERAAFFMDAGAVFIFDLNTPYKHQFVLKNQTFEVETPESRCVWSNCYDEKNACTHITVKTQQKEASESFEEAFTEYSYTANTVEEICKNAGLQVVQILDGDTFRSLKPQSQRMIFVTKKLYTQLEENKTTVENV